MLRACVNLILVMGICLLSVTLHAQSATTGALSGTVSDSSRAAVPGVKVTLSSVVGAPARQTTTNEAGEYSLDFLPPGGYRLEFTKAQFRSLIREAVTVTVTERRAVNVTLEVAAVAERVTVQGDVETVQTRTAVLGRVVDSAQITGLPLATRNFTQITSLSPGVSAPIPDTAAVGKGTQNVYTNGAVHLSNNYEINGVDANNVITNNASLIQAVSGIAIPAPDSIAEFKVQTNLYDAAFGRSGGASISIITKSGGPVWHGNAYEFFRNDALNANNFFFNSTGTARPVLRQNQFGGTLGGPLNISSWKNTAWLFSSYEGTRQVNGASLAGSTTQLVLPPLPANRTRQALGTVFGGQRGAFGGLPIAPDGSNINPVALALLNAKLPGAGFVIPSPQRPGTGVNYTASVPARYQEDQFNTNVDLQIARANTLAAKFFFARAPLFNPTMLGGAAANLPGFGVTTETGNRNLSLSDVHVFGSRTVNELRAGFVRLAGINRLDEPVPVRDIGMERFNSAAISGIPLIAVAGSFTIGAPGLGEVASATNNFVWGDTLSTSFQGLGSHVVRTGAELRRVQANLAFRSILQRGQIIFLSFPDFLLGLPGGPAAAGGNDTPFSNLFVSAIANGIGDRAGRLFDYAFFVADDWKVNAKLSLNLGLRYDFLGNISDVRGRLANFDPRLFRPASPGQTTTAGFVLPRNSQKPLPGLPLVGSTLVDAEDRNNFAPRVGFAYSPFTGRSLVIRGGYGIFYDRPNAFSAFLNVLSPPYYMRSVNQGPTNQRASFENPFPVLPPVSAFPIEPAIPSVPSASPLLTLNSIEPRNRTPYIQQFNLNVQQLMGKGILLEVGYVGSKGSKLMQAVNTNQSLLASPQRPINAQTINSPANALLRVPFPGFAPDLGVQQLQSSGNSSFNSLQASLTKRFGQGLTFLSSYTFAKALNTISSGGLGDLGGILASGGGDQHNVRGNRGPGDFDRAHRFVTSFLYQLPEFHVSARAGRLLLRGWGVGGIVTIQSGLPFSITDSRGATLFGVSGSRASFAPGATLRTARKDGDVKSRLNQFFNPAAFEPAPLIPTGGTAPGGFPVSAAGTIFGNAGRNILRGPRQANVDVAVFRSIAISDKSRLEFRGEFFNIFNSTNFVNPGGDIRSGPTFGVITGTSSAARVIQLAIKIGF